MKHSSFFWDKKLIEKYNITGPRYTSYPTALQFVEQQNSAKIEALQISKAQNKALSLYFHVPFCANLCYFCACNKFITKNKTKSETYLKMLLKEFEIIGSFLSEQQTVEQIHFGGGTPTFLSIEQFALIMQTINKKFKTLKTNQDFNVEIDPRVTTEDMIAGLINLGFNRFSLGVQDLNIEVQKAVNRVQPLEQTIVLVKKARSLGIKSINFDLIYGLPKQTVESFAQTLKTLVEEVKPDRLSVFNYAHLPHRFMPQKRILESDLPSSENKLLMFQNSIDFLMNNGYSYIGMDHFALHDDTLAVAQREKTLHRNFQGYTTHKHCDLIGFGVSSISQINNWYLQNNHNLDSYQDILSTNQLATSKGLKQTAENKLRAQIIASLMCFFEVDFREYKIDYLTVFKNILPKLQEMQDEEMLKFDEHKIVVQAKGKLLIRSIAMLFDEYIDGNSGFSRII